MKDTEKGNHEAQTMKIGCANASVKTENRNVIHFPSEMCRQCCKKCLSSFEHINRNYSPDGNSYYEQILKV